MKTIILLRHARASGAGRGGSDFDRPLSKRGRTDALSVGRFLKGTGVRPDHLQSSTAERARQTTELLTNISGMDRSLVTWNEDLYSGGLSDYLAAVHDAPAAASDMMLVGHNPVIEATASILCSDMETYMARMTEGALLCIEHPAIEWTQVKKGTGRFRWMVTPRLLDSLA